MRREPHLVGPELGARDLQDHARDALPHLGGRAVHLGRAVGEQPDARGAVVVEALRERDVLEADREPDTPANALAARRVAGPAGQPKRVARQLLGGRRLERGGPRESPRRSAASPSIRCPVGSDIAGRERVQAAEARPGRSRAPPPACPSAPRRQSKSARRRSRASRRTAGCSCRRRSPRSGALGTL